MPHGFRELLEKITSEKTLGLPPPFCIFHTLRVVELIGEKAIGCSKLAEELEIGDLLCACYKQGPKALERV